MTTARQMSFAGGEITPSLYGRVDQTKYATGMRTCWNAIVMRHGGVQNRPGTEYITEVKDSTKRVRLIPFIFNAAQTYVLEFGNLYMRVIKDGVSLPAGGPAYEIVTPYAEADLQDLHFAQSADVITIVHPKYAPRELARTGDTAWTLTTITFGPTIAAPTGVVVAGNNPGVSYTYQVTAIDRDTLEESLAASGTTANLRAPSAFAHTITWNNVVGATEYNVYQVVNGVAGYIGTAIGLQFVNDGIPPDTSDNPPVARNPFGSADNYPSTVTHYQQRLMFANTDNDPETVWGSKIGLLKNFTISTPIQDDDAVTFPLVGKQVNEVQSLLELARLVAFTAGAEYGINGNAAGALTYSEVNPKQYSQNGSGVIRPIIVGSTALYVQGRGTISSIASPSRTGTTSRFRIRLSGRCGATEPCWVSPTCASIRSGRGIGTTHWARSRTSSSFPRATRTRCTWSCSGPSTGRTCAISNASPAGSWIRTTSTRPSSWTRPWPMTAATRARRR
jgi:hypothetical protein